MHCNDTYSRLNLKLVILLIPWGGGTPTQTGTACRIIIFFYAYIARNRCIGRNLDVEKKLEQKLFADHDGIMCQCQIRSHFLRISLILPMEKNNGKWWEFVIGARFCYDWQIVFALVFFYVEVLTCTSISSNISDKNVIILHAVPVWVRLPPFRELIG